MASPSPANDTGGQTSSSRYEALAVDRQPYLDRARDCSALTLPYLIPRDDDPNGKKLPSLYQSVGANGVTNLASKLLMTMLPPNEPCFRLRVNNMVMEQEVEDEGDREFQTKINKALSRVEQAVLADIESTADRPVVHEANMHLIVGGNHNDGKSGLRMFPLSRYVVDRDSAGTPVEIIVRETVSIHALPEDFLASLKELEGDTGAQVSKLLEARPGDGKDEVDIYTHLRREAGLWKVRQEVFGHEVPGSTGSYKPEVCPWFPVRMYSIAGENYGRGFVEQQLGDLTSLESLNQAMVEGAIVSSKMLFFVEPNSVTSARAVAEASNGDVLEGRGDDVSCLQVQKGADFQVVAAKIQAIEQSLKTAFLMVDGMRRDKERVTAEEIRMIAQELEAGLGGVYTTVAQEFQLPYIRSRMAAMTKQKRLPKLPKELVTPAIVTGFEAIGRGTDKNKLMEFLQAGATTFGDSFLGLLNPHNAVERLASAMGITTEGLVKTPEELQAEQEQAQQMAQQQSMLENLGPEAVRQGGGMLNQAFAASQQNSNGGNNG